MIRTLATLAVLLAAAVPAVAQSHTIPGVRVTTPKGWTVKPVSDGLVLDRRFVRDGDASGAIIAVSSAPLRTSFDAAFVALMGSIDALKDEDPLVHREGETTQGQKMRWETRCCGDGGASISATTVAFNPPDRMVSATLLEIELEDEDEDVVEAEFEALVEGLAFAGSGVRPSVPRPLGYGTPLEGLWTNTTSGLRPNAFGGMDFVADTTTYTFDPSGAFSGEPLHGAPTVAAFCAKASEGCGIYTIIGARIALKTVTNRYGLVETETLPFSRTDTTLTLGEREFYRITPERNLKLSGAWTYIYASSGSMAFSSGGVSSVRRFTFTPDGRFTRTGSSSFSTSNEVGDARVSATGGSERPADRGRYAIEGTQLTLTGAGPEEVLSFYRPDATDLELLMIDGLPYLREGR